MALSLPTHQADHHTITRAFLPMRAKTPISFTQAAVSLIDRPPASPITSRTPSVTGSTTSVRVSNPRSTSMGGDGGRARGRSGSSGTWVRDYASREPARKMSRGKSAQSATASLRGTIARRESESSGEDEILLTPFDPVRDDVDRASGSATPAEDRYEKGEPLMKRHRDQSSLSRGEPGISMQPAQQEHRGSDHLHNVDLSKTSPSGTLSSGPQSQVAPFSPASPSTEPAAHASAHTQPARDVPTYTTLLEISTIIHRVLHAYKLLPYRRQAQPLLQSLKEFSRDAKSLVDEAPISAKTLHAAMQRSGESSNEFDPHRPSRSQTQAAQSDGIHIPSSGVACSGLERPDLRSRSPGASSASSSQSSSRVARDEAGCSSCPNCKQRLADWEEDVLHLVQDWWSSAVVANWFGPQPHLISNWHERRSGKSDDSSRRCPSPASPGFTNGPGMSPADDDLAPIGETEEEEDVVKEKMITGSLPRATSERAQNTSVLFQATTPRTTERGTSSRARASRGRAIAWRGKRELRLARIASYVGLYDED